MIKNAFRNKKLTRLLLFGVLFYSVLMSYGQNQHTGSWGDQGDGTYKNPILKEEKGSLDVDWFTYEYDGPKAAAKRK